MDEKILAIELPKSEAKDTVECIGEIYSSVLDVLENIC